MLAEHEVIYTLMPIPLWFSHGPPVCRHTGFGRRALRTFPVFDTVLPSLLTSVRILLEYSDPHVRGGRRRGWTWALDFMVRPLANPAHVPCWWMNNPTLGLCCEAMIGRADIEESKSNVAQEEPAGVCHVPLLLDSISNLSHGKAHCHLVSELQAPRVRAPLAADCSLLCILTPAWYKRSEEVKR